MMAAAAGPLRNTARQVLQQGGSEVVGAVRLGVCLSSRDLVSRWKRGCCATQVAALIRSACMKP